MLTPAKVHHRNKPDVLAVVEGRNFVRLGVAPFADDKTVEVKIRYTSAVGFVFLIDKLRIVHQLVVGIQLYRVFEKWIQIVLMPRHNQVGRNFVE